MSIKGVYMNQCTRKLKAKGYSLPQAMKALGISLSTYRRYEKKDHGYNAMLNRLIDELEVNR